MFLEPEEFIASTRDISRSSTHGPFLDERDTTYYLLPFPRRRPRTMYLSESLFFLRVRYPSVGTPHGVTGWRPAVVEPSPPPCGWSTGFIAVPRVCGRMPLWRRRPALPVLWFWWSALAVGPPGRRPAIGTMGVPPGGGRRGG